MIMVDESKKSVKEPSRYEVLYRTYYKPLLSTALQLTHDPFLAEDGVQQTFLRLMKYTQVIDKLREGYEWPYLRTMLRNICIQMLRQREMVVLTEDPEDGGRNMKAQHCISAEDEALKTEYMQDIIGELPEMYAEILILHYLKEMSYEEIGRICHLKPAAVRKRAQRGKEMLAQKLKK